MTYAIVVLLWFAASEAVKRIIDARTHRNCRLAIAASVLWRSKVRLCRSSGFKLHSGHHKARERR